MFRQVEKEIEQDNILPEDHPEKVTFKTMTEWLRKMGARFDHIKMTYFAANFRGMTATQDIKAGQELVYIPNEGMILIRTACNRIPTCSKLNEA